MRYVVAAKAYSSSGCATTIRTLPVCGGGCAGNCRCSSAAPLIASRKSLRVGSGRSACMARRLSHRTNLAALDQIDRDLPHGNAVLPAQAADVEIRLFLRPAEFRL